MYDNAIQLKFETISRSYKSIDEWLIQSSQIFRFYNLIITKNLFYIMHIIIYCEKPIKFAWLQGKSWLKKSQLTNQNIDTNHSTNLSNISALHVSIVGSVWLAQYDSDHLMTIYWFKFVSECFFLLHTYSFIIIFSRYLWPH